MFSHMLIVHTSNRTHNYYYYYRSTYSQCILRDSFHIIYYSKKKHAIKFRLHLLTNSNVKYALKKCKERKKKKKIDDKKILRKICSNELKSRI